MRAHMNAEPTDGKRAFWNSIAAAPANAAVLKANKREGNDLRNQCNALRAKMSAASPPPAAADLPIDDATLQALRRHKLFELDWFSIVEGARAQATSGDPIPLLQVLDDLRERAGDDDFQVALMNLRQCGLSVVKDVAQVRRLCAALMTSHQRTAQLEREALKWLQKLGSEPVDFDQKDPHAVRRRKARAILQQEAIKGRNEERAASRRASVAAAGTTTGECPALIEALRSYDDPDYSGHLKQLDSMSRTANVSSFISKGFTHMATVTVCERAIDALGPDEAEAAQEELAQQKLISTRCRGGQLYIGVGGSTHSGVLLRITATEDATDVAAA